MQGPPISMQKTPFLKSNNRLAVTVEDNGPANNTAPPKGMPPVTDIKFMNFDLQDALKNRDDILNWWQDVTGYHIK